MVARSEPAEIGAGLLPDVVLESRAVQLPSAGFCAGELVAAPVFHEAMIAAETGAGACEGVEGFDSIVAGAETGIASAPVPAVASGKVVARAGVVSRFVAFVFDEVSGAT
jgi:hypothetical protein